MIGSRRLSQSATLSSQRDMISILELWRCRAHCSRRLAALRPRLDAVFSAHIRSALTLAVSRWSRRAQWLQTRSLPQYRAACDSFFRKQALRRGCFQFALLALHRLRLIKVSRRFKLRPMLTYWAATCVTGLRRSRQLTVFAHLRHTRCLSTVFFSWRLHAVQTRALSDSAAQAWT